jgi:hypothetical protein
LQGVIPAGGVLIVGGMAGGFFILHWELDEGTVLLGPFAAVMIYCAARKSRSSFD